MICAALPTFGLWIRLGAVRHNWFFGAAILRYRGSLSRHIGNASALFEGGTHATQVWALDAAHLHANATQRYEPSRGNLGGFCAGPNWTSLLSRGSSEGAHVNSTLKIQKSEAITLLEQIKAELRKRAELKAKRMLLRVPRRLTKR